LADRRRSGGHGRRLNRHRQPARFLYGLEPAAAGLRRGDPGGHRPTHRRGGGRARSRLDRGAVDISLDRREPADLARLQDRSCVCHHGGPSDLAAARPSARQAILMDTGTILYLVSLATMAGLYAILTLGLNLQSGFAGMFNAGIAGFFAVGAYATSILTTPLAEDRLAGFDLPIPVGLAAGVLLSAILGYAVARICLRLKID